MKSVSNRASLFGKIFFVCLVTSQVMTLAGADAVSGSTTPQIDGSHLVGAIREFLAELRSNIERDIDIWSRRMKQMRQEFEERLDIGTGDDEDGDIRRRLLTDDEAAKSLLEKGWDLVLDGASAIKNVMDTKKVKIDDFLNDILGSGWKDYAPIAWLKETFSWEDLVSFEFTSNLDALLSSDASLNFSEPISIGDVYDKVEVVKDAFCSEDKVEPAEKKSTQCEGPSVSLLLLPKSCKIISSKKEILCKPARLVLTKTPGSCTLKHYTRFEWTGKSCKLKGQVGNKTTKTILGGDHFTVNMGEVKDGKLDFFSDIWNATRNHTLHES